MLTLSENVQVGVTVVEELSLTIALPSLYLTPPDETVDVVVVVATPFRVIPPSALTVEVALIVTGICL